MALQSERTYLIVPKGSTPGSDVIGIGPVLDIYPPPDVPAKIIALKQRWLLRRTEGGSTYNVYAGPEGKPDDYKWVVKGNVLFVSSVLPPDSFRFDFAADSDFWVIRTPNNNLLLTANKNAAPEPQLTFKPADGSESQRFHVIPISERDD